MSGFVNPDRLEAARLYQEEGLSLDQVARKMGCSHQTISNWLKRMGLSIRSPGLRSRRPTITRSVTPEFKRQLVEQVIRHEASLSRIAVSNGLVVQTLHRWVTEYREKQQADALVLREKKLIQARSKPVYESSSIRPLTQQELMCGRAGGFCPRIRSGI